MKGQYRSPLGLITYEIIKGYLVSMYFDDHEIQSDESPDLQKIYHNLDQYFHHKRQDFDLKLKFLTGTPFQQSVWNRLSQIPYGTTKSYKEIAEEIGNPKALRAVGQACKRNPIGIVVPCHRVIGKDGSMTGYSGKDYVDLKQKLLHHEQGKEHE